MMKLNM